jgi:hypothetical protein
MPPSFTTFQKGEGQIRRDEDMGNLKKMDIRLHKSQSHMTPIPHVSETSVTMPVIGVVNIHIFQVLASCQCETTNWACTLDDILDLNISRVRTISLPNEVPQNSTTDGFKFFSLSNLVECLPTTVNCTGASNTYANINIQYVYIFQLNKVLMRKHTHG